MWIFLFQKISQAKEMINFSRTDKHQDVAESVHKKLFQMKWNMIQLRIH